MELKDITDAELKFRPYRFWSDWVDMGMFNYACSGYLLQMSVNRFNGKRFKSVKLQSLLSLAESTYREVNNG